MKLHPLTATAAGLCLVAAIGWQAGALGFVNAMFLPKEYIEACKTAGVRFFAAPRSPVNSVALDYLPTSASKVGRRYEFAPSGRVERVGTLFWQPRIEQQVDRFELRSPYGPDKPDFQFYRYQREDSPILVATMSAEVLVKDTVSHSEELQNAVWQQGMVSHHLTVTDLRNGEKLAEMVYVVDLKNHRACGSNTHGAIDVDLFVLQAAAVPIIVPDYEKQRRQGATVKNW